MTTIATLEVDADFGNGIQTGVFELGPIGESGRTSLTENIRTGFLVDSQYSSIVSAVESLLADGEAGRAGIHIDAGGGQHTFEIEGETPGDARKPDGAHYQWGSSPDPSVGPAIHTATGANPIQQMQTLMAYLRYGSPDSLTPATFRYGEYATDGYLEDGLPVVVESPTLTHEAKSAATSDLNLTLVETTDLDRAFDATVNSKKNS